MPPTVLINSLERVRRKVRVLSVLFGLGVVICAGAGLLLATVLLDYLLNLPTWPRLILIAASLSGMAYLLAQHVVRPALAKLGLSDVAGKLESAFPIFNDRLRSTVDFATKGIPGSEMMKERVVNEATELAQRTDLSQAIATKPLWYSSAAAIGAIAFVLLLGGLAGSDYLSPALRRLFMPFGTHPWPKRVEIQLVGSLPSRVPVGNRVEVQMRLAKGDRPSRQAIVFYQYGDGRVEKELMTRGADGLYSASLDARADLSGGNGVMKVWMESGDDATAPQAITVVQRLVINRVDLEITPPPYVSGQQVRPVTSELSAAPVTVTEHSSLTLKAYFNKPLDPSKPFTLQSGLKQTALPEVRWEVSTGSVAVGHWLAGQSCNFQLHATDLDGFSNPEMTDYQVVVRPDQMPSVQVIQPTHNDECMPQAIVRLQGIAEDDFGIQSAKLLITRVGEKGGDYPAVDLVSDGKETSGAHFTSLDAAGERRRWQIDYTWDLAKMANPPLKPGDVIEYRLQVRDNYSFEGKYHDPVDSGKLRISILSDADFHALIEAEFEGVRQAVVDLLNTQKSLKSQTGDLQRETSKAPEFAKPDRDQAQQIIGRQSTAASLTQQLSGKMDELRQRLEDNRSTAQDLKDVASDVKDTLKQTAEDPMKKATTQIENAKDDKADPKADAAGQQQATDRRNSALADAQTNQQKAADNLGAAAEKLGSVGGLSKAIETIKALLEQQKNLSQKNQDIGDKNLGKTPEQMDPKDRQGLKDAAADQDKLGDKAQDAINNMDKQGDKMAKTDPSTAKAMKDAAKTGQQQQVPPGMKSAAQQMQQNKQSGSQQSQKQVEIGLEMMLRQLEEAKNRQLAEAIAQLEDLQKKIAELIKLQATLNYDNLRLQGPAVVGKIDAPVIKNLQDEAEIAPENQPPIQDLGVQTRLQEQNEHNSRSFAADAQRMDNGAEVESQLSHAADRMSRAITFLRDDTSQQPQRLASAYDPPQIDALAALEKARDLVDEALKKSNQQMQDKQRETIRAKFEKILADQKVLDSDTVTVDKSPRNEDGELSRKAGELLRNLPDRQQGLSETADKISDDLRSLGGIVYVWSNNDIVTTMKEVKGYLQKPDTGQITQAEQTRIEEQLQAMIESLKIKPKQSQFKEHTPPGGGGGGAGASAPRLPGEAELRLLKALQVAVQNSTAKLDQMPQKDDAKIASLGGRQSELRNLLGNLIDQASHHQLKLDPEPKGKVPEETNAEDVDKQEMINQLLGDDGQPKEDEMKDNVAMAGHRMYRSHARLSDDKDPGKVTQLIQKRILDNLDALIQMAQAQQSQSSPSSGKNPMSGQAQANNQQPANQGQVKPGGATPAPQSVNNRDVNTEGTPAGDIAASGKEWGSPSPRLRQAINEANSEHPIEKFRSFISDYYRSLAQKATETEK